MIGVVIEDQLLGSGIGVVIGVGVEKELLKIPVR
jgi:hypothetical protein